MEKVIVLTGGATGIGAATVSKLKARGCQVIILDVFEPASASGTFIRCDLSDPSSIDAAIKRLPSQIDVLINVAGISNAHPGNEIMKVNFLGMRQLTQSLIPSIANNGNVVIVASSAGFDWRKRKAVINEFLDTWDFESGKSWLQTNKDTWIENPYKFSKQSAAAYTYKAAGLAVDRGIRVNCVNPGSTGTALTKDFRQLVGEQMYDWGIQQIGRQGTPDDIAEIIEFLAIGECRWLNGVELNVDGGFIAGMLGGWIDLEDAPTA
jgi:NAD(P)-dependent dehydrogenase (short-subunit alcohol dehydrogenase family)